ncbi:MAG: aldolase/citrate lyase family protein [Methylovirgula sp.]
MRSLLLVRADCENEIERALDSGADCLVFDLAWTAAAADKPPARDLTLAGLKRARQRSDPPLLYVRVNDLHSALTDMDLDSVMPSHPDGIVLPGAQNGADIQHLSVKLAVREAELGFGDGATKIIAMAAATPASIFEMGSFAGASRRLAGLIFGADGLASALGPETRTSPDGTPTPPFALARSLTLFAAKAANVMAIDAASPSDTDEASLRRMCETARRDGFSGKLAAEPAQLAIINAIFGTRTAAKS